LVTDKLGIAGYGTYKEEEMILEIGNETTSTSSYNISASTSIREKTCSEFSILCYEPALAVDQVSHIDASDK
jgi:hypothetical protein